MTALRNLTLSQRLILGFALPLALVAVVATIGYRSLDGQVETSRMVTHTHEVLGELEAIDAALKDAETGQRGFLITGEDSYLAPYEDGRASLATHLDALAELTSDNPVQQDRIATLRPLVDEKLAELAQTIELRRTSGFEAARDVVLTDAGKAVMDEIRTVMGTMESEEVELLAQREADAEASASGSQGAIVTTALVALLLAGAAAFVVSRSTSRALRALRVTLDESSGSMAAVSSQLSSNAEETSAQAQVVSAAADQVSANVQTVATAVEELSASVQEIAGSAHEASQVAGRAVSVVESTNARVSTLGASSVEIGQVVEVITSIAEQTNLLALNATIEAARAGEAGKGFAVVANEVKALAQQTAQATEEIGARITAIQGDSAGAVEAMEEISGVIAQIADLQTTIASAVEEQTATTNEVARNVSEAAAGSNQIAENVSSVAQAAASTAGGAVSVQQSAGDLAEVAARLRALIERPRADVDASSDPSGPVAPAVPAWA